MQKPHKQNNNKGVFTPFTRPKVSEPKETSGGEMVSKKFFASADTATTEH